MEKDTPAKELTPAEKNAEQMIEIEKKAESFKEKYKTFAVYPIVFINEDTKLIEAVGYLKEASLEAKLAVMDIAGQGRSYSCATQLLDVCLIKEESDPRISSTEPANHKFYLGAVTEASKLVKQYTNQFKKKLVSIG